MGEDWNIMNTPTITELGQAISSTVRVDILTLVSERRMTIGELAQKLNLSQSTTSYHTGILLQAGLVRIHEVGCRHAVEGVFDEIRVPLGAQAA